MNDEASEVENISFIGCYATWLKNIIYAATNIGAEFLCISKYSFRGNIKGNSYIFKGNSTIRFNYRNDRLENSKGLKKGTEILFTFHVKFFLGDKNNVFMQPKKTNLTSTQNVDEKLTVSWGKVLIIEEKLPKNFSMRKLKRIVVLKTNLIFIFLQQII